MEIEFDVKITTGSLYDYMLRHTFTSFSGILGEIVGVFLIFGFLASRQFMYLAAGIIVICYVPVALFFQAKRQASAPAFKEPLHYKLTEEGIEIEVLGEHDAKPWSAVTKVVSTGQSIVMYTGKVNASIFPWKDIKAQKTEIVQMISTHVDPKKVNIRL